MEKYSGYIHDAVPDNYVEQPPSDFKAVAKNSEILTRILNSDQTETGLKDLIEKLKNLIYPKIESFVHDAKIVLSEQFNFDLTGKDFSLPQVEAAFKREEKNIDPQIRVWIDDMIKDIHYLNEMHKLEDPNYLANLEKEGGGKHEISLHIVPISGLVAGVFCRLSNECKTVCELWEPPELDDVTDRTDLHSAVIQANFDSIFTYLQSVPDHINSQDSNGFTPLHYCASSYTLDYLNVLFLLSLLFFFFFARFSLPLSSFLLSPLNFPLLASFTLFPLDFLLILPFHAFHLEC